MRLKKLELYGFKSFAQKTKLELGKGITAIVGPNGSGKSNLSDAIRWTLGEQSARQLRGSKMEDVIFGGSSNRKALGMSEVSLHFDNEEGILPIDFNEITVTRRIFRSGESEYRLNNAPCRLKDIYDLFAGTGVGRETYATIEQGKIDLLCSARPEDRRIIFEEAAGILKYKNKKREALNKLQDTAQKILRLNDLIREISGQLGPLGEARQKALFYEEYNGKLQTLEQLLTLDSWARLQEKQNAYLEQEINYQKRLGELQSSQQGLERDLEQTTVLLEETQKQVGKFQEKFHNLLSQFDLLNMEIRVGQEREQECLERKIKLNQKQGSLSDAITQIEDEILGQEKSLKELETKIHNLLKEEIAKQESLQEGQHFLREEENQLNNLKSELIEILNLRAKKQYEVKNLQTNRENLRKKQEKINQEIAAACQRREQLAKGKDQLNRKKEEKEAFIQLTEQQIYNLKEEKEQEKQKLIEQNNLVLDLEKRLQSKQGRLNLLLEMERSLEGYGKGVKSVLQGSRQNSRLGQGVCGTIAELLKVPEKYEKAIEIALGQALQNIVTETDKKAQELIEYLKETKGGRATFLPLNIIQGNKFKLEQMPEALGLAVDLICFAPRYEAIMNYLLGRIIVVENLDRGLEVSKKLNYKLRVVTLDGDVLNPGGAMTGGSLGGKQLGILGRIREKEELGANLEEIKAKLLQEIELKKLKEDKLATLEKQLQEKEGILQQGKFELQNLEKEWLESEKEEKKLVQEEEILLWESRQLEQEEESLRQRAQEGLDNFNFLEKNKERIEQEINLNQQKLLEKTQSLESRKEEITQLKIQLAALRQEKANGDSNGFKSKARLRELLTEKDSSQQESVQLEEQILLIRQEIQEKIQKLQKLNQDKIEMNLELEKLREEEEGLKKVYKEKEKIKKSLDRALNSLEKEWSQIALLKGRVEVELTYQLEQLKLNFSLQAPQETRPHILVEEKRKTISQEAQNWAQQIRDLGPVNLGAVEEYENLKKRYDFLVEQGNDLQAGKRSLEQLLEEIDQIMQKRFLETFVRIQEEFKLMFQRLFNGGKAQLSLSDPNKILETGIDIMIQPPGKKLQNLTLLSGGEKGLTAVALLFAILKVNPSPFCLLDEIDAAFDDANVKRVADLLKEFAEKVQFIVITHRKGIMEVADALYGVTMEEAGISRLISVKLTERAS